MLLESNMVSTLFQPIPLLLLAINLFLILWPIYNKIQDRRKARKA